MGRALQLPTAIITGLGDNHATAHVSTKHCGRSMGRPVTSQVILQRIPAKRLRHACVVAFYGYKVCIRLTTPDNTFTASVKRLGVQEFCSPSCA